MNVDFWISEHISSNLNETVPWLECGKIPSQKKIVHFKQMTYVT